MVTTPTYECRPMEDEKKEESTDTTILSRLVGLYAFGNWDVTCEWAEENIPQLASHLETWGPHCGAPRKVYLGHIVRMLIDIERGKR